MPAVLRPAAHADIESTRQDTTPDDARLLDMPAFAYVFHDALLLMPLPCLPRHELRCVMLIYFAAMTMRYDAAILICQRVLILPLFFSRYYAARRSAVGRRYEAAARYARSAAHAPAAACHATPPAAAAAPSISFHATMPPLIMPCRRLVIYTMITVVACLLIDFADAAFL